MSGAERVAAALRPFARLPLLDGPTPLVEYPALGSELGGIRLFIKRDDLGLVGAAGNKLRKLEFAVAAARAQGADTLITYGALQSNHARLTAAVAARSGMRCELVLSKRVPRRGPHYEGNGNLLLARLFGATIHLLEPQDDAVDFAAPRVEALRRSGRRPHVIPFGGSDALGALGYVQCAGEIVGQLERLGRTPDHVVVASGSGGTQAGLIAGLALAQSPARVHGISVLHPAARLAATVRSLTAETLALLRTTALLDPLVDDTCVGEGYGIPTDGGIDAIRLLAVREAVLLDPVYTGKAFAGLRKLAERGGFARDDTVVFVHTGGLPGVFAYADAFSASGSSAEASA